MIKAYQHEIEAGLVDALNDNVIALSMYPTLKPKLEISLADILPPTQFTDLFYFEDILVSSGWNGNDDIFSVAELWKARETPMHKKINYMHDEKDIIGVMCKVKAMSFDGQLIDFATSADMLPKDLDLHVGGYLYKLWKDQKLQARMDDILQNIDNWCVSMECTFPSFDYGIIDPAGQHFVIARNEKTSFLTKHLRIYGGVGEYEGYKVGRYLKDFTFTGKGMVKNPANKRSVITNHEFIGAAASLSIFPSMENEMDPKELIESLNKQVADLTVSVANLKTSEATKIAELESAKAEIVKLTAEITKLNTGIAGLTEANEAQKTKVAKLESELTTSSASLAKANEELEKFNQEKTKATRLALFSDVDVDAAKATELVNKFISVSDEMFTDIVAAMPKKKAESKKDEKEDKKDTMSSLETVVVEASIASLPKSEDKTKAVRESAVAWLASNMNSKKGE